MTNLLLPGTLIPMNHHHYRITTVFFLTLLVGLPGCTGGGTRITREPVPDATVRSLRMFDGHTGEAITWNELMERSEGAQVVVMGEQHDDRVGHAVQRVFVQDFIAQAGGPAMDESATTAPESQPESQPASQPTTTPASQPDSEPDSAPEEYSPPPAPTIFLSLEMLDRTRQATVDDYLADLIDREVFIERTATTKWRKIARKYINREMNRRSFEIRILSIGWPDWEGNYQPTIDIAKEGGAGVIAANSPWRRYTTLANKKGYERLEHLTPIQKTLFTLPDSLPPVASKYRERFWDVMVGRKEGESTEPEEEESTDGEKDDSEDDEAVHPELDDETLLGTFRAQYLMDTTMARSIADAIENGASTVIHLVGHFHSDFNGGTVEQVKKFLPDARVLTISMWREDEDALREEDKDRADIMIYTGAEDE